MSARPVLLLVEADKTLLQALSRLLREICAVDAVETYAAALDRLDQKQFDIILVDIDPPAVEGLSLYRKILERPVTTPILLLTGGDIAASNADELTVDPDDVISKPIRMALLQSKIEARLRRSAQNAAKQVGPFAFYGDDRCLFNPTTNKTVRLTEKERDILVHLLASDGAPVSREALLAEIWGYSPLATTHTLETHIYRLRQKLTLEPAEQTILISEAGGYRLAV